MSVGLLIAEAGHRTRHFGGRHSMPRTASLAWFALLLALNLWRSQRWFGSLSAAAIFIAGGGRKKIPANGPLTDAGTLDGLAGPATATLRQSQLLAPGPNPDERPRPHGLDPVSADHG